MSQNIHPSSSAPDDLVSVRALAAPTRREIEALAEIFEQYRAHYGEASNAFRSASWLDENISTSRLRVFVAEDGAKFVGFAVTMNVPASLRLAHFWQIRDLFVLPTHRRLGVGRALLASVRAAAIASSALRRHVVTLTRRGEQRLDRAAQAQRDAEDEILASLTPEQRRQLRELLLILRDHLAG